MTGGADALFGKPADLAQGPLRLVIECDDVLQQLAAGFAKSRPGSHQGGLIVDRQGLHRRSTGALLMLLHDTGRAAEQGY